MARAIARASWRGWRARSVHVLFSLCQGVVHVQCGTDVTRLRTSAMQLAMGLAPADNALGEAVARTSGMPGGEGGDARACDRARDEA